MFNIAATFLLVRYTMNNHGTGNIIYTCGNYTANCSIIDKIQSQLHTKVNKHD